MAAGITGISLWKMYQLEKEVRRFARKTEQRLDGLLLGREIGEEDEAVQDTLWGRCEAKFSQAERVWKRKEEANRKEKRQWKALLSDISHQTKTPIANIRLYLELLEEERLSQKGTEFLEKLGKQAEKLDFLLQSMVKMSRLETGIMQMETKQGNLYDTLAEAVAEIVPEAAGKQIELSVDCAEYFPLWHDRKWTEEAIFNVLDNAVKYTEPGGKIHVQAVRQEMFTQIAVSDTGKGIQPERQAEIFTRFYREPEVHEQKGVGIGLYLTRKILELQNGYIEVKSRPEEGAQFCLYLPNEPVR